MVVRRDRPAIEFTWGRLASRPSPCSELVRYKPRAFRPSGAMVSKRSQLLRCVQHAAGVVICVQRKYLLNLLRRVTPIKCTSTPVVLGRKHPQTCGDSCRANSRHSTKFPGISLVLGGGFAVGYVSCLSLTVA
jgi:hypothetical protein